MSLFGVFFPLCKPRVGLVGCAFMRVRASASSRQALFLSDLEPQDSSLAPLQKQLHTWLSALRVGW